MESVLDSNYAAVLVPVLLIGLNLPLFYFAGRLFWNDLGEFFESLKFYLMPDFISLIRGELFDDWWSELKLVWFGLSCTAIVFLEIALWTQVAGG